eukprot:5721872-Amphidinium_carterae.2
MLLELEVPEEHDVEVVLPDSMAPATFALPSHSRSSHTPAGEARTRHSECIMRFMKTQDIAHSV